jgi:hypothetical protein
MSKKIFNNKDMYWIIPSIIGIFLTAFFKTNHHDLLLSIIPLLSAGLSLGGNIAGAIASSGDRESAQNAYLEALRKIEEVGAPPELAKEIFLEKFKQAGILTPELENAVNLDTSEVSKIEEDPRLRQLGIGALEGISERGQVGLTAEDRAAFNVLRNQVAKDEAARRARIVQQYQERGMGGAGAELAAQLASSQAGTTEAAAASDRLASEASERALRALSATADISKGMRSQDFDIASEKAKAADAIKQFNIENEIARQRRNVESKNVAQKYNLGNLQDISDKNVALQHQQSTRSSEIPLKNWQNKLDYAQKLSTALTGKGDMYSKTAQDTAQRWSDIGGGLAGIASTIGKKYLQDEDKKEDGWIIKKV